MGAGASWNGGVAPGTGDDAVILNGDTITLTSDHTVGSLAVQAGGDITGGGYELECDDENGAGFALDIDGDITGDLDILFTYAGDTQIDIFANSGNVRNIEQDTGAGNSIDFFSNSEITGDLTVTSGTFRPQATTITWESNDITIEGKFGRAAWTGTITCNGDFSGSGTYDYGQQEVVFDGSSDQIIGSFTFYDLTIANTGGIMIIDSGISITVEDVFTINASATVRLYGGSSDTTLTLGTSSASGEIANAGTLQAHTTSGSSDSIIQAANTSHYADLTGAGVYDWDYGTTNGEVHWKWLYHKGTGATAKTTGGGGVTVKLLGGVWFDEDFEIASGDTLSKNSQPCRIGKDWTETGTITGTGNLGCIANANEKIITNVTANGLIIRGTGDVKFDGTNAFTAGIVWSGSTADLLAYDSDSIITATGGITVPATAYFGGNASGDLGDGNDISTWDADISLGYINNSGDFYFTAGTTTVSSHAGNVAITNADTIYHNTGVIKMTGTAEQQIDTGTDDLYRLDNSNTSDNVVFNTSSFSLDGIWWRSGTVTEADGVDVTLTGYTPSLGAPENMQRESQLSAAGRLVESNGGDFVFDHDLPSGTTLYVYRVLRGEPETDQEGVDDVYVKKSENKYDRIAKVYLDDYDGGQADSWKYTQGANTYYYGCPVHILWYDSTAGWWKTHFKGFMSNRDSQGTGTGVVIECYSYDQWLKARTVDINFTHRNHTLKEILQQLIEKYTPVKYLDANVDLASNRATLQPTFQGETVDEAISSNLEKSGDEEYGVNDDMEFFTRQRATAHDGTYDAPVSFTDNWYDYSFERQGNVHKNRVEVYYGSDLDNMVAADDRTAQTEMQTELGSEQPVVITMKVSRKDLKNATDAQSYADWLLETYETYWGGTVTSYECEDCDPGMITEVTIAEMDELSGGVAFKIMMIEYFMSKDETILHLQEPTKIPTYLPPLSAYGGVAKRAQVVDIQNAEPAFGMQSTEWDTQADFNLWGTGANCAVHAGGYIFCTGATVGAEINTSPWLSPGTGKDAVSFWEDLNTISVDNGGTVLVYVEGSVTGVQGPYSDWEDISSVFANTEDLRLYVTMEWDGITGASPTYDFGRIRHK